MNNNAEGRVAVESTRIGAGGDRLLAQITGLDAQDDPAGTTRNGWGAFGAAGAARPTARRRSASRRKKDPALERILDSLVQEDPAGDPNSRAEMGAQQSASSLWALRERGTSC